MILMHNHRGGRMRNTEKPYFIEWYYDLFRVPWYREYYLKGKSEKDKIRLLRYDEDRWSYYRSYRTIDDCVQAWNDMTKAELKRKNRTIWYRIKKTDFSTWPTEEKCVRGDGKIYIESLILNPS